MASRRIEGVRTPSKVAAAVMDFTDHHLIVGKGAQDFARNMGFTIEADLNTERSRKAWLEWKRRTDPGHYLRPEDRQGANYRIMRDLIAEGVIPARHFWGTINCNGINAQRRGLRRHDDERSRVQDPGPRRRLADPGRRAYVDDAVGAAGSTGRGEANLYNLSRI